MAASNPNPKVDPETYLPDLPPEQRDGVWIHLDGGNEDTTVRRIQIPEHIKRGALVDDGPDENSDAKTPRAPESASSPSDRLPRSSTFHRQTAETDIRVIVNLDGSGKAELATGIGFFDHMLTLFAKHSLIDLTVEAKGDLHVDAHHTVEDVGICLGEALRQALGNKTGIRRYGSLTLPMDETLVTVAIDLSGRAFCAWNVDLPAELLGTFNAPLAEEFWRAIAVHGQLNLHILCHYGRNSHHIIEAVFKACARAIRQAIEFDPRISGVPSTKGSL